MKLNVKNDYFKQLKKRGGTAIEDYRYRQDDTFGVIDTNRLTTEDLEKLRAIAQEAYDGYKDPGAIGLVRKINTWFRLQESPDKTKITHLDGLVEAVRLYFKDTPHRWVFVQEADGEMIPFYVTGAAYTPPDAKQMRPSVTSIELESVTRGQKEDKSYVYHVADIGVSLSVLLERRGLYRETPEMVATYEAECARYKTMAGLTGTQFLARGRGFQAEGYYNSTLVELEVDGAPTKVVMDDTDGDEDTRESHRGGRNSEEMVGDASFWKKGQRKHDMDEEETAEDVVILPTQPYVKVFDLAKHRHVTIHVNSLETYVYDETMTDKLILPEADKDLVHILAQGADEQMEDIVKGKTGGIIVITTGPPGTGKTLTAETISELVRRPLYSVQCSQLGISPEVLEKKLGTVLNRAARWGAILLVDEADVYVHERGADILQNAIVGVWLRILEYYKGIMFMTSNRSVIIDDAILSRATAWIRYDYPTSDALTRIWQVLAKHYGVTLSLKSVETLVRSPLLGHISGRTVKNLLKLARLLSLRKKQPITVEMIQYVSQYADVEITKEDANSKIAEREIDAGGQLPEPRAASTRASQAKMVRLMESDHRAD